MRFFKSKKSKVLMTCLAVVLIVSVLSITLAGCKPPLAGETPLGVYFVGDFQKDVAPEDILKITKDGEEIVSINEALTAAGAADYKADPAKAAAAIYATAVTNYNNVTQTGYYILTDASVSAKGALAGKDVNVGIRSTYSSFTGKNGYFQQTVSGVTRLDGVGSIGNKLRGSFGYNIQNFSNDSFSAFRKGENGGAQFPTVKDDANVYKYILGGYNKSLSSRVKGGDDKLKITTGNASDDPDLPEYEPAAGAKYPDDSTLKGVDLPSFNKDRKAWEPLNRLPARYWEKNKSGKLTGKIIENYAIVEKTKYCFGTYGAGFAVYDFSRPWYLSDDTVVSYNEDLDLWTVEVKILDDYVNQACEFAAGDLIRDTQAYIGLKNAKFTKISVKFEVYGSGLIKSMQKIDELSTKEKCPLKVLPGTCERGGATSNTATMAFSYSDNDTDALRYAALYWPELGQSDIFKTKRVNTNLKLDLSGYETFADYKPEVNEKLMASFNNIFAKK